MLFGVSYELELDEDRVKALGFGTQKSLAVFKVFLMVCGGDEEVEIATLSRSFAMVRSRKTGVVAGRGCGVEDIWFWFYCSKNKRYLDCVLL